MRLQKARFVICSAALLLFVSAAIALIVWRTDGHKFARAYASLRLGATKQQVVSAFGRSREFWWSYRGYEIWYFTAPGMLRARASDVKSRHGIPIDSLAALPDAYGCVQLAFSPEGRLFAYTWIGETHCVIHADGTARGSHLKVIEGHFH